MIFEIIIVIIGVASLIYIIKNFEIFTGIVGIAILLIIAIGLLILLFLAGRFLFSIPGVYNFIDNFLTWSFNIFWAIIGVSLLLLGLAGLIYFFKDVIEAIVNLIRKLLK